MVKKSQFMLVILLAALLALSTAGFAQDTADADSILSGTDTTMVDSTVIAGDDTTGVDPDSTLVIDDSTGVDPDSTVVVVIDSTAGDSLDTDEDEGEQGEDDELDETGSGQNVVMMGDKEAEAGRQVVARVMVKSREPVYGAAFDVEFDNTRLLVMGVQAGNNLNEGYELDSVDLAAANSDGTLELKITADSTADGPMFNGNSKQIVLITFVIDSSATGEIPVIFSDMAFSGEQGIEIQLEPLAGVVLVSEDDDEEEGDSLEIELPDSLEIDEPDSLVVGDTTAVEDDSTVVVSDSTLADSTVDDSLVVESDSLDTDTDSLVVSDTTAVEDDSTMVVSDSTLADSTVDDSLVVEPDSLDEDDPGLADTTAIKGDLDGNGKLGVPDMLYMLRYFHGEDVGASTEYDINDDGKVDIFDLLDLILQISGKKKGLIKNADPDGNSRAGDNGRGVWSGSGGTSLASAGTGLILPDGSVLSVAEEYTGSSLVGLSASGGLAGELLGVAEAGLSVAAPVALPRAFALSQNYPNPFNPSTTIQYEIGQGESVSTRLTILNIRGQVVKTLVSGIKTAGIYQVQWDGLDESGRKVSSGVYFYRIVAGEYSQTRKMVLVK